MTGLNKVECDEYDLHKNLLDYYMFREICFSCIDRFEFAFRTRYNILTNEYNKLWAAEKIKFNPMLNQEIKKTGSENSKHGSEQNKKYENMGQSTEQGSNANKLDSSVDTTGKNTGEGDNNKDIVVVDKGTKDTITNKDGTTNKTGESDRKNTASSEETNSKTSDFYDTPQTASSIPSNYHTDVRTESGKKNIKSTEDEHITNNEDGQYKDKTVDNETTQNTKTTHETGDYNNSENTTLNELTNTQTIGSQNNDKATFDSGVSNTGYADETTKIDESVYQGVNNKSYSKLLLEYRLTIRNIDLDFIREFDNLFMGVL